MLNEIQKLLSHSRYLALAGMASLAQADTVSAHYSYTFTPPAGVNPPYFVTQPLSVGQSALNISNDGVFDAETPAVKWGPFLDSSEIELSFDLVGESTGIGAPEATDASATVSISDSPVMDEGDAFLAWLEDELPGAPAPDRSIDANLDGDEFPNFVEFLLGFDPLQRNDIFEALRLTLNGDGSVTVELDRLNDDQRFQVIVERVNLETGEKTPLSPTSTLPGSVADFVTEVFQESGEPVFVRVVFAPYPAPRAD